MVDGPSSIHFGPIRFTNGLWASNKTVRLIHVKTWVFSGLRKETEID